MEGVGEDLRESGGGRDVVAETTDGERLAGVFVCVPGTKERNEDVGGEFFVQDLGDEEHVGHQRGLEDDGHVGGVEQFDGVSGAVASHPL